MADCQEQLKKHFDELKNTRFNELLNKEGHSESLQFTDETSNIILDLSHTKMNAETVELWDQLVKERNISNKIEGMFNGEIMNVTEKRQVMHVELRSQKNQEVEEVLDQIRQYTKSVRSGESKGYDGKSIENILVIGIGGSYLSIEFVYEALRLHADYQQQNMKCIRFLSNVDPIDFKRCTQGLDPSRTLVVINSKTFTTAETMMNARTVHKWILDHYQINDKESEQAKECTSKHMVACSTNVQKCSEMGITNIFKFWDWVGGRFSVTSCIGILPLALYFGTDVMDSFLQGCQNMDQQFRNKPLKQNLPLLLGLLGYYNTQIQKLDCRSIIPYCQALSKFVAHIQQLDMESNGKQCDIQNQLIDDLNRTGSIIFGEPGTNSQHSFFQLLHQGRQVAVEFIGYCKSQNELVTEGMRNHDELMSNFFSQPDALALGKQLEQLEQEQVNQEIINSKIFKGERGSISILFKNELNAYNCGQLLSMYEHRVAVEGWLLGVNSFDQMGVELGKVLAVNVRNIMKKGSIEDSSINKATSIMLQHYLQNRNQ